MIRTVVGIDPDTSCPSYAYVRDGQLQSVHYERGGPRVRPPYPREVLAVCEAQFVDRGGRVPDKDILALAWAAGESSMHFDRCERIAPSRWKGDVPKATMQTWVRAALNESERFVLAKYKQQYILREVLDAVGIALWKVGRLK